METTRALREEILVRTAGKNKYGGGCNVRDARALCRDVDTLAEALRASRGEMKRRCSGVKGRPRAECRDGRCRLCNAWALGDAILGE